MHETTLRSSWCRDAAAVNTGNFTLHLSPFRHRKGCKYTFLCSLQRLNVMSRDDIQYTVQPTQCKLISSSSMQYLFQELSRQVPAGSFHVWEGPPGDARYTIYCMLRHKRVAKPRDAPIFLNYASVLAIRLLTDRISTSCLTEIQMFSIVHTRSSYKMLRSSCYTLII